MLRLVVGTFTLISLVTVLSACQNITQGALRDNAAWTWTSIAQDDANEYFFDPYKLYRQKDGVWVVPIAAQNKTTLELTGPFYWGINCVENSFSENSSPPGSLGYDQNFRPIPRGSNIQNVSQGFCGVRWPYDQELYFFATNVLGPPIRSVWLRGNEVEYRLDGTAEIIAAYSNSVTGVASPIKISIDCQTRRFTDIDLITGTLLTAGFEITLNSLQAAAIIYDRACNPNRSYMTRRYEAKNVTPITSQAEVVKAQQICENLGLARNTKDFSICVEQFSHY